MGPEEPWSGAGRPLGLLALVRHFGATIVALIYTRIELVATEVEEELQRGVIILIWAMLALFFGALSVLMLAVTLLVIFWDDHRVLVAALITSAFIAITAIMGFLAQARVRSKPRFLAASIEELKRDRAFLERKR
jgi:uncharacterized membrane protein YqjE